MNMPEGFDSNKYIYHYTRADTAIDYILSSRTLQLSQFANLNDPKESKFEDIYVFGNADLPFGDTRNRLIDFFRLKVKAVCFSRDDQNVDYPHPYSSDMCSRGYAKSRMWATYGDNHKGVCLVFDKEKLRDIFTVNKNTNDHLFYGSVNYGRIYSEIMKDNEAFYADIKELNEDFETAINKMISNHWKTYFLFKHEDWVTENEYRFLLVGDKEENEYLPFKDALAGIAVGMDISEEDSNKIITFSNENNIPAVKAEWGLGNSTMKMLNPVAQALLM